MPLYLAGALGRPGFMLLDKPQQFTDRIGYLQRIGHPACLGG